MVAAFSQHAVGAMRERGEEASRGRRLQARGAMGARGVGRRTGLWKRHHTGAASTGSYGPPEYFLLTFYRFDTVTQYKLDRLWSKLMFQLMIICTDLPRNCRTLVRVLLWAALVLGRRVPCPSDTLSMSKPNTQAHKHTHTHTHI